MNTARWMMAHFQQLEIDKLSLRQSSRLLGTLLDDFEPENPLAVDSNKVRILPLTMFMNPELFKKIRDSGDMIDEPMDGESSLGIPDDVYEKQIKILESGGQLTDIDSILVQADEKLETAKQKRVKVKLRNHLIDDDDDE